MKDKLPPRILHGNKPGKFGRFETRKVFDWKTVIIALGPVVTTLLIPWLESQDTGTGSIIAIAAAIGVITRALIEWAEDNSKMRIPDD